MLVGVLLFGVGGDNDVIVDRRVGANQSSSSLKDCEEGAGRTTTAKSLSSFWTTKCRMFRQSVRLSIHDILAGQQQLMV